MNASSVDPTMVKYLKIGIGARAFLFLKRGCRVRDKSPV
jgi:hypothetical protein